MNFEVENQNVEQTPEKWVNLEDIQSARGLKMENCRFIALEKDISLKFRKSMSG